MLLFISINKKKNQLVISIDRLIFIPFKPLENFFDFCIDFFPFLLYNYKKCRCGGIGRHKGLKIPRSNIRTGSSPVSGTITEPTVDTTIDCRFVIFMRKTAVISRLFRLSMHPFRN